MIAVALMAAVQVSIPAAVDAQSGTTAESSLKDVERQLDEERKSAATARTRAEIMSREINKLQQDMVSTARAVQQHEEQMSAVRTRLTALERLRDAKNDDLRDGRAQFGRVLSAMQRIAQFPPEALIAQPQEPADTVRTAILLRAAVTEIDKQASTLRDELNFITRAKTEIVEREKMLAETSALLDRERRRLGALMSRKKVLKRRADNEAVAAEKRVAALAAKAKSLQELMRGLAEEKERAEKAKPVQAAAATVRRAIPPISEARGRLVLPAVGRVNGRYGEKTESGLSRKGITMKTPKGAQIVATYDGDVVYAGQFRGYGLLLIIEHGEGYHTLLAGMSRIDAEQGQRVLAGEPVGVMEEDAAPVLYVEFRRDGQPINPLPWLAARKKDEING